MGFTPPGGGGTPTNITVANEAADTECFPLFVTAATGDLAPKSNAGIKFNSSTGLLTLTGLAGPLTGNADTVTNATLTTALTVDTGTLTLTANVADSSVLTIGAGASSISGANTGDNTVCTSGTATTAATLATARTIGGVSFDGSANIDLPGVNTGGNQDTSGKATTAGNADTVSTITGLAPDTATTAATQGSITSLGTLTSLTMGGEIAMGANKITGLLAPTNGTDAVNYDTLLSTVGIDLAYFFGNQTLDETLTDSEASLQETPTTDPETLSTITFKSSVADTPTPFTINNGTIIPIHFNADVTAIASKHDEQLKVQLGYVDADGTSNFVQIGSNSGLTDILTEAKTEYNLHIHIATEITVPAGKRLWLKFIADATLGGASYPEINVYYDEVINHLQIPVSSTILDNFVSATTTITDHVIVRGDGGVKGVQATGITITDADVITGCGRYIDFTFEDDTYNVAPFIKMQSARASSADLQDDDYLGDIRFYGRSNGTYQMGAVIGSSCDGTPGGATDMPSDLFFQTSPNASATPVTRLTIGSNGVATFTETIVGSINGNAGTVSTITGLAPDTATTQATQASITTCVNLVSVGALASGTIASGFGTILTANTIQGTVGTFTAASSLVLGTASSTIGGMTIYNGTNANTVIINSGTTSGSYTLTLPLAVAGAGEALTDAAGDGVLSWAAAGGGLTWGDSITSDANETDEGVEIILHNTQDNAEECLYVSTGTSAQANKGISVLAAGVSTSQRGLYIDMSTTGTGMGAEFRGIDSSNKLELFINSGTPGSQKFFNGQFFELASLSARNGDINVFAQTRRNTNDNTFSDQHNIYVFKGQYGNDGTGLFTVGGTDTQGNVMLIELATNGGAAAGVLSLDCNLLALQAPTTHKGHLITGVKINSSVANTDPMLNFQIDDSQTNPFTIAYLDTGTSAVAHVGLLVDAFGAHASQRGIKVDGSTTLTGYHIECAGGAAVSTNFKKYILLGTLTIWTSDGTTAEGNLTGVEGDICLNGGTGAGQTAYCDANGTNWTDM